MTDRKQKYIKRLNESRAYLEQMLDRVGDRWDEQLYADGAQWTIRQLLIHLMLADKGHNSMVMMAAKGTHIIPEDYDIDRYNASSVRKNDALSPADARAALRQSRAELLAWIDAVEDSVLDIETRHASLQILPIYKIFNIMAWHEKEHADDIAKHLDAKVTD